MIDIDIVRKIAMADLGGCSPLPAISETTCKYKSLHIAPTRPHTSIKLASFVNFA